MASNPIVLKPSQLNNDSALNPPKFKAKNSKLSSETAILFSQSSSRNGYAAAKTLSHGCTSAPQSSGTRLKSENLDRDGREATDLEDDRECVCVVVFAAATVVAVVVVAAVVSRSRRCDQESRYEKLKKLWFIRSENGFTLPESEPTTAAERWRNGGGTVEKVFSDKEPERDVEDD